MIGVVDATDQETHQVVNVEFHDKSARRGYHFSDQNKYTMASLGEQGIVYACPSADGTPSMVHYRGYDSWASASDWQVSLPAGEDALSVAAGGPADGLGAVVVATSRGFVRFFTASGIQRYLWRLGEDVVTMAAERETVLIVHREGGTSLDGCQNLRYTLLDLDEFDILQEGRIPLPKKATIRWCGFTSDGAPVMYDSAGLLSVLDRYRRPGQARWVPLFDGTAAAAVKTGKREGYWPVGVSRTHMSCVLLRGSETEPWFPRPLIQEVDLCMPLLGLEATQGTLEESVMRGRVVTPSDDEGTVGIDKLLLQLVQGACKADQLSRALDLGRMMTSTSTLDAAHKIATFYHLPGLGEKIAAVKYTKERGSRHKNIARDMLAGKERVRSISPQKRDPTRQFGDFAPSSRRRTFGRASESRRPETPGTGGHTFLPETPGDDDGENLVNETPGFDDDDDDDAMNGTANDFDERVLSPPPAFAASPKRKRERDEDPFAPKEAKANPFAKRDKPSNPFAKPAQARPLDSVKSTSFFDRVDDIEVQKRECEHGYRMEC
jgi:chromosome transmission fidelity protein 4